ncbi:hypothetical protein HBD75_003476 [Salmonella enterica]|nr:hypothetical protein [Salmonella enterica]EEU4805585.1 hypothetical protein [Salmonella enterica]EEU4869120.1 hypothetical protein [Salmonella enterica]EEU4896452.1 hypothetical protein [Salmonella enterica]
MRKAPLRSDTTVRINEDRKLEIKRKIIEIGSKTGEILKVTDVTNYLIDHYLDEAVKDIISDIEIEKKKNQ